MGPRWCAAGARPCVVGLVRFSALGGPGLRPSAAVLGLARCRWVTWWLRGGGGPGAWASGVAPTNVFKAVREGPPGPWASEVVPTNVVPTKWCPLSGAH